VAEDLRPVSARAKVQRWETRTVTASKDRQMGRNIPNDEKHHRDQFLDRFTMPSISVISDSLVFQFDEGLNEAEIYSPAVEV
jgi:hypothetical protein